MGISARTVQRRLVQATGLTQSDVLQIERARYATTLLKQGLSILDTVHQAGYYDQPHLTRSLKHYVGQTPAQLANQNRTTRLSLLYKTAPLLLHYDSHVRSFASSRELEREALRPYG
jgi:AraC-like DNA-binding protein